MLRTLVVSGLAVCLLAGFAARGEAVARPQPKLIGVVETLDQRSGSLDCHSSRKIDQANRINFSLMREVVFWEPGLVEPRPEALTSLSGCIAEANQLGIEVMLTITHNWDMPAPRTADEVLQFSLYAAAWARALPQVTKIEIGNEPNSSRFLRPQCSSRGRSLAPLLYYRMLSSSYDMLKAAGRERGVPVLVFGGAMTSTGSDKPCFRKKSHSPVKFIQGLARVFRASGRRKPFTDFFTHHPYPVDNNDWPWERHGGGTVSIADMPKLRRVISRAFAFTAQPANRPIFLSEFAYETVIPDSRLDHYEGLENQPGVPTRVQRQNYLWVLRYVDATPWLMGLAFFHTEDEYLREGWQSGLFYADHTPKASAEAVGRLVDCLASRTTDCG